MRRVLIVTIAVITVVAIISAIAWNRSRTAPVAAFDRNGPGAAGKAVPAAAASPADDGNWTMPGKDYASTRFSGLNEINPSNVGQLKVATTFSTGTTEGFEAPPLVVGDTMYIVAPWPRSGKQAQVGSFCCPVLPVPLESILLPGWSSRVLFG